MAAGTSTLLKGLVTLGIIAALVSGRSSAESAPVSEPSAEGVQLEAVSAVSASDAWAVGRGPGAVIEHWDGRSWTRVRNPSPPAFELLGVSARSVHDVWAVGGAGSRSLVEHWDGHHWTRTLLDSPGYLYAVSAVSADDVWAVGGAAVDSVILHWDGDTWQHVPNPNPGGADGTFLGPVSALSASDAWTVGVYSHLEGRPRRTLIEHWDGATWSQVPSPSPGGRHGNLLNGVTAVSPSDAWAVGNYQTATRALTLIEHWDGTSWSQVPSPNLGKQYNFLASVTATSPTDVWAVGDYETATSEATLIEHWDGSRWRRVPSPNSAAANGSLLEGVTAVSATRAFAVGFNLGGPGSGALFERWNGKRWTLS